jgi:HK97 family phage major capsid protein
MALTARGWLGQYEDECRALEAEVGRIKAAAERSIEAINQAGGEGRATPEMLNRRDGLVEDYTQVKDKLRRAEGAARHMRGEVAADDEYAAKSRESHPGARPLPPGQLPPVDGETRVGDAAGQSRRLEVSVPWQREDGRPAALDRSARTADNPVVQEIAGRDPGRHITEVYSGVGQLARSLSTTGASALIPTLWSSSIIDKARNAARVIEAGAETIPMDSKQLNIGRLNTDVTASWIAEAGTRTPSDPAFDLVSLVSKTMTAFTTASLEFLQDAPNANSLIEESLGKAMGLALDLAALFGGASGTDFTAATGAQASPPGPLGILGNLLANYPAGVLGGAANGTAITAATPWNELLTTYFLPVRNNEQPTAILMNAAMQQKYSMTYDTLGQSLRLPPALQNVPQLITNQIPSFTQGTMANIATDIFCGDFRQVLIGTRLEMTLQVLTERYAEIGSVGLLMTFRGDIQLARPKAMAVFRYIGGS